MRCQKLRGSRQLRPKVFAFSAENWSRLSEDVVKFMAPLTNALAHNASDLESNAVQLLLGDKRQLPALIRYPLMHANHNLSSINQSLRLNICFNYEGRWDIAQAELARESRGAAITVLSLDRAIAAPHIDGPDLLVRTGGKDRADSFTLWRAAYSELHFFPLFWPEFGERAVGAGIAVSKKFWRQFGRMGPSGNNFKKVD